MKNLDIIEFNKVLNFEILSREVLYISFYLAILLVLIVYIYSKYSEQIAYIIEKEIFLAKIKKQYLASISAIDINDHDFFYKINFNIKSFLDELGLFPWITKMTKKEIFKKNYKISELKWIMEQCEKYEFSTEKVVTNNVKQSIKDKSLLIIKSK